MNEEIEKIVMKFNHHEETIEDVYKLKNYADQGDTKAALNYGICLFVGHLIGEDKEEASKYFEKVYISGKIEELNELAQFYEEVGGAAYQNMSDMIVDRAISKFKNLNFDEKKEFIKSFLTEEKRIY